MSRCKWQSDFARYICSGLAVVSSADGNDLRKKSPRHGDLLKSEVRLLRDKRRLTNKIYRLQVSKALFATFLALSCITNKNLSERPLDITDSCVHLSWQNFYRKTKERTTKCAPSPLSWTFHSPNSWSVFLFYPLQCTTQRRTTSWSCLRRTTVEPRRAIGRDSVESTRGINAPRPGFPQAPMHDLHQKRSHSQRHARVFHTQTMSYFPAPPIVCETYTWELSPTLALGLSLH